MDIVGISMIILGSNFLFLSASGDDHDKVTSNVAIVSLIGYMAFLVGPPFLGIMGQIFGISNALFNTLLFVLFSGLVSFAIRENKRGQL